MDIQTMTKTIRTPVGTVVWEAHTKSRNAKRAVKYPKIGQDGQNLNHTFDINQTVALNSEFVELISQMEVNLETVADNVYNLLKPRLRKQLDKDGQEKKDASGKTLFETSSEELMLNVNYRDPIAVLNVDGTPFVDNIRRGSKISIEGDIDVDIWTRDADDAVSGKVRFYPKTIFVHEQPDLKKSIPIAKKKFVANND